MQTYPLGPTRKSDNETNDKHGRNSILCALFDLQWPRERILCNESDRDWYIIHE